MNTNNNRIKGAGIQPKQQPAPRNGLWVLFVSLCLAGATTMGQTYTILHEFNGADGKFPEVGLSLSGTTLYGSCGGDGGSGGGTLFKIPAFRVVIVYEDVRTATQARRAYEFLVANLAHEWQVTRQMWKFEMLRLPELRALAVEDAVLADLILVSCHGDGELPADVRAWIEMWLGCKADTIAVVALLDCPPGQAERTRVKRAYFERVAERACVDFFTWPEGLAKHESLVLDWALASTQEPLR